MLEKEDNPNFNQVMQEYVKKFNASVHFIKNDLEPMI